MSVLKGRNKGTVAASVPSGPIRREPLTWGCASLAPRYLLSRLRRVFRPPLDIKRFLPELFP